MPGSSLAIRRRVPSHSPPLAPSPAPAVCRDLPGQPSLAHPGPVSGPGRGALAEPCTSSLEAGGLFWSPGWAGAAFQTHDHSGLLPRLHAPGGERLSSPALTAPQRGPARRASSLEGHLQNGVDMPAPPLPPQHSTCPVGGGVASLAPTLTQPQSSQAHGPTSLALISTSPCFREQKLCQEAGDEPGQGMGWCVRKGELRPGARVDSAGPKADSILTGQQAQVHGGGDTVTTPDKHRSHKIITITDDGVVRIKREDLITKGLLAGAQVSGQHREALTAWGPRPLPGSLWVVQHVVF